MLSNPRKSIINLLQVKALEKAKEGIPTGRWWLKADACHVRNGLRESVRGVWAGDEDLGDRSLQVLFTEYKERCAFVKEIGSPRRVKLILEDVKKILSQIEVDLAFLKANAKLANDAYAKVLHGNTSSEQSKMELAWNVIGFEELLKKLVQIQSELNGIICGDKKVKLLSVKSNILSYLKGLYSKKRVAATHILVFIIADELRNCKPYAVPIRFIPYKSIRDGKLRQLELELEGVMRAN